MYEVQSILNWVMLIDQYLLSLPPGNMKLINDKQRFIP